MSELKLSVNFAAHIRRMVAKQINYRVKVGCDGPRIDDGDSPPQVLMTYRKRHGSKWFGTAAKEQWVSCGRGWLLKTFPGAVMRAVISQTPVDPTPYELHPLPLTSCPVFLTRSEQWAIDAEAEDGRYYA